MTLTDHDILKIRDQVLPGQGEPLDVIAFGRALERRLLDTPELDDFASGVVLEALHQRRRWGTEHDAGKEPGDWLWLLGHLANKALNAAVAGDHVAFKHHTISTAAALANWRANVLGVEVSMRPGIDPVERGLEALDPRVHVVMRFLASRNGRRVDRVSMPNLLELAGLPFSQDSRQLARHVELALHQAGWSRHRGTDRDRTWTYKRPTAARGS